MFGLLPVFGGAARFRAAADALQVRRHAALLDAFPFAADLFVVEAVLAVELVVDVVPLGALVDEVPFALRRRAGADHAVLVLGPLVVDDVAGNGAVELTPRRFVRLLPATLNAAAGLDDVEVAELRVEVDAVPRRPLRHFARLDARHLGLRLFSAARGDERAGADSERDGENRGFPGGVSHGAQSTPRGPRWGRGHQRAGRTNGRRDPGPARESPLSGKGASSRTCPSSATRRCGAS